MVQRVAQIEFQSALKQHQNNGQCSQQIRRSRQLLGVDQSEHRTEQQPERHQHHDIGNAGEPKNTIGQEGNDEQPSDHPENQPRGHS
jgi:hypothetical protein